jgi:hypothetical protein
VNSLECQATNLYRFVVAVLAFNISAPFFLKEEFIQATILERTAIGQNDALEEMKKSSKQ